MTVTTDSGFGAPSDVAGEQTQVALSAIRVSGGVLCSYRASLAHDGLWEEVRAAFAARSGMPLQWLDGVSPADWVSLDSFRTLLASYAGISGLHALRAITRSRMADSEHGNFYAPMLRSWMRSFGDSVERSLRCVVPLWRAAVRNALPPELVVVDAGEIHVRMTGPMARAVRCSAPLGVCFEGILLGILDLPRPQLFVEIEFSYARNQMLAVCRF